MVSDPALPPSAPLLIDVSASETLPPGEALQAIASILATSCDRLGARIAVLVATPVRYGLARQLGAWLDPCGLSVRPFHERAAAVEWLRGVGDEVDPA